MFWLTVHFSMHQTAILKYIFEVKIT